MNTTETTEKEPFLLVLPTNLKQAVKTLADRNDRSTSAEMRIALVKHVSEAH